MIRNYFQLASAALNASAGVWWWLSGNRLLAALGVSYALGNLILAFA